MTNEIYGFWTVKVDDRNRVRLPAGLMRQIEGLRNLFYVFINPGDEIFQNLLALFYAIGISIFPYRHLILLPQRPTPENPNLAWVANQLNHVEIDKQGRITLYGLRDYGGEVYILGQGKRIEIWPIDEYNRRMKDMAEMYKLNRFL
jgi:DNA-binding transcriptional regulator/RsmH inhibitor MraZ